MEIGFYHATRGPAEAVAPRLIAKALAAGHRLLVHSAGRARLEALDRLLWTFDAEAFLPHGLAGGAHDARQPCLLSDAPGPPANAATLLLLLDGPLPEDGYARLLYLFDEAGIVAARAAWKALARPATYWKQAERGWEKAAAKP